MKDVIKMAKILKSRRFQGSEMYSLMSCDQISLHSSQIFPVREKNKKTCLIALFLSQMIINQGYNEWSCELNPKGFSDAVCCYKVCDKTPKSRLQRLVKESPCLVPLESQYQNNSSRPSGKNT